MRTVQIVVLVKLALMEAVNDGISDALDNCINIYNPLKSTPILMGWAMLATHRLYYKDDE
jgi:hypothetical protein